ncbi:peptidoglycan linked protein (LPXTG motif) [Streptococcus infantarius subsp. infantarius]|nr:peptidoglycan linked protein (LPXTG motif) [Streptococcus infantarius subsp. infantarius]
MLKLWARLAILVKKRVRDSIIAKIALVLSLVVVFCTTYLLILPALTISTGNSSSVFQSSESASSQVESPTDDSQKENNQTEASSQASLTDSSQEKKDMSQAGTLTAETSDVTVTVSYEGDTFTEPVQLKVKPVSDTTAIDNKLTSLLSESKQSLSQAHSYDISFITDGGKEVEPSKDVKVSMAFKNDLSTSDDKQAGWKLYHFVDNDVNQVQDLTESTDTDIKETSDGAVESVDFKSNTFSTYTLAGVTYADFSGYLTGYSYNEKSVQEDLSTEELSVLLHLDFKINQKDVAKENHYYLALPDDTAIGKDLKLGTEYTGRDNNTDAFKYQFKKDDSSGKYYLLISFLDSYVAGMGQGVQSTGYIDYEAVFGLTHRTSHDSYTVKFSDGVTIEILPEKVTKNYDLSTSKTGKVSYDGDTPYIDYTVTVDSKYGTPGNIDLTDSLTADGVSIADVTNVSITKSTYTGDTSHVTGTETVSTKPNFDKANKKWSLTLPQLVSGGTDSNGNPIGHFYTITYRYKIADLTAGNTVQVNNTIKAVSKNDQDKREASSSTSVTLKLNDIKKSGKYDKKTGKITWTITVNPDGNDIGGATLKDDFFKKAESIEVTLKDGSSASGTYRYYDSNNNKLDDNITDFSKVSYIRFSGQKGKKSNTKTYVITYTTDAKNSSWNKKTVTNTVTLDDDGDKTSSSAKPSVPGDGNLEKTSLGENDTSDTGVKTLSWQTKITMPASGVIEKGTNFRDFLTDPWNQNSEVHWYTKAQLQDLYKKLVKIFGDSKFTLEARQNSWGGYTNYEDLDSNTKYTEFQIILTDDFKSSKNIVLQYQSTAKLNGNANIDFWNTISSADHSSQAKYHHTDNSNVIKMDGDENHATTKKTSTDGVVTWKVKVNLSDDAKTMTVTDNLPNGVHLTGLVFGRHYSQTPVTISGNNISALTGQYEWGATNMKVDGTISSDNVVTLNFSTTDGRTLKQSIGDNNDFWLTYTTASVKLYYADSNQEVPSSDWSWKVSSTDDGWGNLTSTLTID